MSGLYAAVEVPSLTQRYGLESLSQHVVEHCHEARSLYYVLGQYEQILYKRKLLNIAHYIHER